MRTTVLFLSTASLLLAVATPASAQFDPRMYGNPDCSRFFCDAAGRPMGNAGTGPQGGYVTDGRGYYQSYGPPPNPYAYGSPYYSQPYYGRPYHREPRSDESVAKSTIAGAIVGALIGFAVAR